MKNKTTASEKQGRSSTMRAGAKHAAGEKKHDGAADGAYSLPPYFPLVLERRKLLDLPGELVAQMQELDLLARQLIRSNEEQQQSISRELHDNIAQVLAAVTNRLSLVATTSKVPAFLRQELEALQENLKAALEDIRLLARELRPCLLDHGNFATMLEKHALAFRERTKMTLDLQVDPVAAQFLDGENLTHLFRLTQEAMQNIEEHSGATSAWLRLAQNDGEILLEIGDNGQAFTPQRVAEAQNDGHLGLFGMRERAELLGGSFRLESVPGQGTMICVCVPVPPPPRKRR